jgi:hypothetical protein
MAVGVFISYNHADIRIANALQQCLLALSDSLSVFIDHAGLEAGDEYEAKLARYISASQWFLIICSGPPRPERDMGWCLLEAGQFRAKLLNENHENMIRSRVVSIHDDERPRQLSQFQSVRITTYDRLNRPLDLKQGSEDTSGFEGTDAFRLFETIIERSEEKPLRDLTDENVRSVLRDQARRLTRAFVDLQSETRLPEIVLQPRISFRLPPSTDDNPAVLSNDIKVIGYESSLRDIFGMTGTETTWGEIKLRVKEPSGQDPIWLADVEDAATQVAKNLVPEQPEGLCPSRMDGKFYRVLFTRYEPYRNGARTCYVVFIPCRPRQFEVKQRTSILLSALILSIRFRQKILPLVETIRSAPRGKKVDSLVNLERELHQVETEAQEFGLSIPGHEGDESPLIQVVREGEGKAFMEESIKSWTTERTAISTAMSRLRFPDPDESRVDAISEAERITVEESEKVRSVNSRFIQLLTEELLFTEKVGLGAQILPPP